MKDSNIMTTALDKLTAYVKKYSDLDEKTIRLMVDHIPVKFFNKGNVLIEQGEKISQCFFVIEGCARKYSIDIDGHEVTSEFFVENQTIAIFGSSEENMSQYSVSCLEDSVMIVGDLSMEQEEYDKYPELGELTRRMMEESMGKMQDAYAAFIGHSSEERVRRMMNDPSKLFDRVPRHQMASFLGITPESLSRITRRVANDYLKAVE